MGLRDRIFSRILKVGPVSINFNGLSTFKLIIKSACRLRFTPPSTKRFRELKTHLEKLTVLQLLWILFGFAVFSLCFLSSSCIRYMKFLHHTEAIESFVILNSKTLTPKQFSALADETSRRKESYDLTVPIGAQLALLADFIENESTDENSHESDYGIYFHWDDWTDLGPSNVFFKTYRKNSASYKYNKLMGWVYNQDDIISGANDYEIEDDIAIEGLSHQDPYYPETTKLKALRGALELYSTRPIPKQIIFMTAEDKFFKVPIKGKYRYGKKKLYDLYYKNNLKESKNAYQNNLEIDTKSEMQKLLNVYKNRFPNFLTNNQKLNSSLSKVNGKTIIEVPKDLFYFKAYEEIKSYNDKYKDKKMPKIDEEYVEMLKYGQKTASKASQWFKYPMIIGDDDWHSHHWAYPFFKQIIHDRERFHSLHHIVRVWFKFCIAYDVPTWINYGSLIGWHYNGLNLPYDADIDVQIPIRSLAWLGKHFNGTFIVEDPELGNGLYYFEVTPWFFMQGNNKNFIDARIIDVRTGTYIDISALKAQQTLGPERLYEDGEYERGTVTAVRCKNYNWFVLEDIIPLRRTLFEGAEAFIPHNFDRILDKKYGSECYTRHGPYHEHRYQDMTRLWVSERTCKKTPDPESNEIFDDEGNLTDEGSCGSEHLKEDYNLTKNVTSLHQKEMEMIYKGNNTMDLISKDFPIFRQDPWRIYKELIEKNGNGNSYW